jgi:hypothetical protein
MMALWKYSSLRCWGFLRFRQLLTISCSFVETGLGAKCLLVLAISSAPA